MAILTDFTFRDTGITVKIRKVNPNLFADIDAQYPKPQPPEQEVDYGEPRGKVMEANLSDPNYEKALVDRAETVYKAWKKALILRGVVLEGEGWKEDVQEYRDFIQSSTGSPMADEDDRMIYVLRVCVGTPEDQDDLIKAITRRSQPTPEAVNQAKSSFQRSI